MAGGLVQEWFLVALLVVVACLMMMMTLDVGVGATTTSVPALYVFGDSTVDTGNNNYINTTEDFRSDFPPYGQDFFGKPTGRFSNGRVIVDFIAEYAGHPLIPPYLQKGTDLSHGANFGSGGAGVLSETNKGLVLDFNSQLNHFREHQAAVIQNHGQAFSNKHFSEAVYIISIGSNDYLGGYYGDPVQREKYTPEKFVQKIVTDTLTGIEILYKLGATKIVVLGLGPMGCLPALRALDPAGVCLKPLSDLSTAHNGGMVLGLDALKSKFPSLTIVQGHFFDFFSERLTNPAKYGYENAEVPCCGAGPCAGQCRALEKSTGSGCELCKRANEYVWWDMYHPTETIHKQFAEAIWGGNLPYVQPISVAELFKQRPDPSCMDKLDLFPGAPLQQMVSESFPMS